VTSPLRGEVWLVDLGLAAKVRPALVISIPPGDADRALVTLVPHTTSVRGSRFEVGVPVPFLRPGAFDAQSLVTIPMAKLIRRLGRLHPIQLAQVEQGVCSWLGIVGSGHVQEQAGEWAEGPSSQD
jgi:mRNA interferase MazF